VLLYKARQKMAAAASVLSKWRRIWPAKEGKLSGSRYVSLDPPPLLANTGAHFSVNKKRRIFDPRPNNEVPFARKREERRARISLAILSKLEEALSAPPRIRRNM